MLPEKGFLEPILLLEGESDLILCLGQMKTFCWLHLRYDISLNAITRMNCSTNKLRANARSAPLETIRKVDFLAEYGLLGYTYCKAFVFSPCKVLGS